MKKLITTLLCAAFPMTSVLGDPTSDKPQAPPTKEEIASTTFYQPAGCKQCFEGFKGRAAISEALLFNKEIRHEIIKASGDIDDDAIRDIANRHGMLSLRDSGRDRIKDGLTTLTEIKNATAEE